MNCSQCDQTLPINQVWEVHESKHKPGAVLHTLGWPLDQKTYGGSFLYHMKDRQVTKGSFALFISTSQGTDDMQCIFGINFPFTDISVLWNL